MSIQSTAGLQQDYWNCMHSLDNSCSSMYEPHAQDSTNGHYSPYFEPPYDKYQMSSGQTSESNFDDLNDMQSWISEYYHSLTE